MKSETLFLEIHRLFIKIPSLEDFDDLCQLNATPEVMRYIDPAGHRPEKVRERLAGDCSQ